MAISAIFDAENWAHVPFHFWSVIFFVFGSMIGSFLNVCIHRMPLGESIVSPPSHCPHCKYSIPWFLNFPLITWLYLKGKCANCSAPISIRYFLVELLTGLMFLGCWLLFGHQSVWLALVYCLFLAGLIVATFIDFAHFIIPDEITFGGMVVGFLCSAVVPAMHGANNAPNSMKQSFLGILVGGGLIYLILRIGKLAFGRQKLDLSPLSKIIFTETAIVLPDQEILYEELFYRRSDIVRLHASIVELSDRCYRDVAVSLTPAKLTIGDEVLDPTNIPYMEATTEQLVLPREAMGLGDVKFMAAIGAFLGWPAIVFSLMVSSIIGSIVGITLIVMKKQAWSSRLPYGPYIALAAAIWVFGGHHFWEYLWMRR
ncbi:MAG: Peptidase domain protein [Pedosphaera sp.]|nr:Peptidase domain protein [Pedosphaera sp.]